MAARKRKGLEVRCEDNEDMEKEAGSSTDLKKRQVSKSTFDIWQRKHEEYPM